MDIIGEYQCGIKKDKFTIDYIHTLRQLMEKYYGHNIKTLMYACEMWLRTKKNQRKPVEIVG